MCLAPILIKHPRLRSYAYIQARNESKLEHFINPELQYLEVPCGTCPECRRLRAAQWRIRLHNEFESSSNCIFCTLTFNEKNKPHGRKDIQQMLRKFFFRYRWYFRDENGKHARIPKHWFIVERGKLGRLHLHGFIFDSQLFFEDTNEDRANPMFRKGNKRPHFINRRSTAVLQKLWQYGFAEVSTKISPRAISYATKYSLKQECYDSTSGIVYCSPGIGKSYYLEHRNDIIDSILGLNTPLVKSGTKMVPAPRYYTRLALREISSRIECSVDKYISELLLLKSIRSKNTYPKTFRGVLYKNEADFLAARRRDFEDFRRSPLYDSWKKCYEEKRNRISRYSFNLHDHTDAISDYRYYLDLATSNIAIEDIRNLYYSTIKQTKFIKHGPTSGCSP